MTRSMTRGKGKDKKKKKPPGFTGRSREAKKIQENIEFVLLSKAECACCGDVRVKERPNAITNTATLGKSFAKDLYLLGWREIDWQGLICLACPACMKLPADMR